jgi:hypothetical protein
MPVEQPVMRMTLDIFIPPKLKKYSSDEREPESGARSPPLIQKIEGNGIEAGTKVARL